jgi:probable HAF family extracellular repeat protein
MHVALFVFAAALLLAAEVAPTSATPQQYQIVPIEPADGYVGFNPTGINAVGQVVGTSMNESTGVEQAMLWRNGAWSDMGQLIGVCSRTLVINDAGLVAGEHSTAAAGSELHAFVWDGSQLNGSWRARPR